MSYTDPSGFFFDKIFKFIKKYWKVAVAAVISYVTYGAASTWATTWAASAGYGATAASAIGGVVGGAAAGAVAGGIVTGSLSGAAKGALTGAIMGGVTGALSGTGTGLSDSAYRLALSAAGGCAGGCAAGAASGGSCSEGAKLAVIAQSLSIGMEMYSHHKPTWKGADGEAVVKAKSDMGVHNPSVTNVGQSIEIDTIQYPKAASLVGRKLSSLTKAEINILNESGVSESLMSWSGGSANFGLGTEYHLGKLGVVPGMNSMAVFHDYWMASQNVQNFGYLAGTIGIALPINYISLGVENYNYVYRNIDD